MKHFEMTRKRFNRLADDFYKITKSKNIRIKFDNGHLDIYGNEIEILRLVNHYKFSFSHDDKKVSTYFIEEINFYQFTLNISGFIGFFQNH